MFDWEGRKCFDNEGWLTKTGRFAGGLNTMKTEHIPQGTTNDYILHYNRARPQEFKGGRSTERENMREKIAIASNLSHEIFDYAAVSKPTTGSGSLLGIIFPSLRSGGK